MLTGITTETVENYKNRLNLMKSMEEKNYQFSNKLQISKHIQRCVPELMEQEAERINGLVLSFDEVEVIRLLKEENI